jgi:hypothetical protein
MKIKLVVTHIRIDSRVDGYDRDEFFADDNWKVIHETVGSAGNLRATGSLRVEWDAEGTAIRLAKVYAPGQWLTWEKLPE